MIENTIKTSDIMPIGIDPGKSGAVAYICNDTVGLFDTPTRPVKRGKRRINEYDIHAMCEIIKECVSVSKEQNLSPYVFIEKIHAMPKQGVSSMFSMGEGYGVWQGIVCAHNLPILRIPPQTWKSKMLAGVANKKDKNNSYLRAKEMYPQANLKTPRGRILHDRAEALLLAHYGKHVN